MSSDTEMVEKDQTRLVDEYGEYVMLCRCDIDTFQEAIIDCSDARLGNIVESFQERLQTHSAERNPAVTEDIVVKLAITLREMSGLDDSEFEEILHKV